MAGALGRAARQLAALGRPFDQALAAAAAAASSSGRGCCGDAAAGKTSSSSSSSVERLDKILLQGLTFHGYHGVLPEVCVMCVCM